MSPESLLKMRYELLTELAFAFDPVRRLLTDPGWESKVHFTENRFAEEMDKILDKAHEFCRLAHLSHTQLRTQTHNSICELRKVCRVLGSDPITVDCEFNTRFAKAYTAIKSLPCEDISTIFPSASPFTTYCTIRAACRGATKRVEVFDPYIDNTVFHRYLCDVDPSAQIAVVTDTKRLTGNPNTRDGIVAVSELLALERPTSYRLLEVPSIHDRYARIDDTV